MNIFALLADRGIGGLFGLVGAAIGLVIGIAMVLMKTKPKE